MGFDKTIGVGLLCIISVQHDSMGCNIPGSHMKPLGAPLNLHSVKRVTEVSSGHAEQVKQVSLIYTNIPGGQMILFR